MSRKRTMTLHIKCPNCRQRMFGYKVADRSSTLTECTYECRNELCKITCLCYMEVKRIIQAPVVVMNLDSGVKLSPLVKEAQEAINNLPTDESAAADLGLIDEAMPQQDFFRARGGTHDSS